MNPVAGLGRWVGGVVALGALARVVRFGAGRSLWNDEAQLALNIWGRDALGLLSPLDFGQSAPYGFLLLERLALWCFGPGELALRSVSLCASLAALALFCGVARAALSRRGAQLAVVLFATSEPLVFYASELKPYALDVCVAVGWLALLLPLSPASLERRSVARLAILGALAPWFSFPAVFGLAAAGLGFAVGARGAGGGRAGALLVLAAAWLGSAGLLFILQVGPSMGDPYLHEFWQGAFAPFPPASLSEGAWYLRTLSGFFVDPLALPPWWLSLGRASAGAVGRGRRRPAALWWLLGPLALGLLASMLEAYPLRTHPPVDLRARVYPFVGRLWLFALPAVLLLVAAGVAALADRAGRWRDPAGVVLTLAVAGLSLRQFLFNVWDPPVVQEFRPVAVALRGEVESADQFWVQRGSEPTFEYYARLLPLRVAARNVGATEPEDLAQLEREIGRLDPGSRVWLVSLTHPAWDTGADWLALVERLEQRAERESSLEAPGARAIAYRVRATR